MEALMTVPHELHGALQKSGALAIVMSLQELCPSASGPSPCHSPVALLSPCLPTPQPQCSPYFPWASPFP